MRGRRQFKVEKAILNRYVLRFLRKEARLSQDFSVVGHSFQRMGAATEKARLPRFSFVLGIESCCEVDDLSCLGDVRKLQETSNIVRGKFAQVAV